MSSGMLFLILLVIGVVLFILGIKASDKSKLFLMLFGAVIALFGGFGVFTSLL
jgi:hypothetical protein